ncbi:MAG: phosphoribosylglycinamide formyltransferase [Sphingomonadaceae bacterium]|nr:phosphoribosylglycinamide formyltransferase [Sphingomonadaceae bacterium]
MSGRLPVGVLISGRGSNMAALLRASAEPECPYRVACVLSDRADAAGLGVARAAGVAAEPVPPIRGDKAAYGERLSERLQAHGCEAVALAGFMRVLADQFCSDWAGRLLNVHPSLLPAFPGLDTHSRALAAGCKLHGCTVHYVVPEVDAGPIIAQAAVPVLDDDTPDTLAARALAEEHRLYPQALAAHAAGRLSIVGQRVLWDAVPQPSALR